MLIISIFSENCTAPKIFRYVGPNELKYETIALSSATDSICVMFSPMVKVCAKRIFSCNRSTNSPVNIPFAVALSMYKLFTPVQPAKAVESITLCTYTLSVAKLVTFAKAFAPTLFIFFKLITVNAGFVNAVNILAGIFIKLPVNVTDSTLSPTPATKAIGKSTVSVLLLLKAISVNTTSSCHVALKVMLASKVTLLAFSSITPKLVNPLKLSAFSSVPHCVNTLNA